jgi:hypothetical protein
MRLSRLKAWLFAQSRDWDPECDEIHRGRRRFYDRYHTIRRRRIMHSSPAFKDEPALPNLSFHCELEVLLVVILMEMDHNLSVLIIA